MSLGQYFTISDELQQFVFEKVQNKGAVLLEPSFGAGHLMKKFLDYDPEYPAVLIEIDSTLKPVVSFTDEQKVIYADFLVEDLGQRFMTIIGNPPYVKTRGQGANLYIKFIDKCFSLLDTNGELIFIVPSDFIKLTSAGNLIERMVAAGSFTDFFYPGKEGLFSGASVDVMVFRYQKDLNTAVATVNGVEKGYTVRNGILSFTSAVPSSVALNTLFDVYVGIVSGRDEVYRQPFGNVEVLMDKGRKEKFIVTRKFPTGNKQIDQHLQAAKAELLGRKIRTFTETNWFEWGALRNIATIRAEVDRPCIYVRNITRNKEVAFEGLVQMFGGGLLCMIPRPTTSVEQIKKTVMFLNSDSFQKEYIYAGRFKIGQKQLCNVLI
jgi:adenine-specific DNA-methyltransferase